MKYALNLSDDNRVLSVTFSEFAPEDAPRVDEFPEGNITNYRFVDGEFVFDPLLEPEPVEIVNPQADTDAMLIDHEYRLTLLELGITE